ncbi:MAG: S1C family serine protease [Anaerotardibacter sp.]
MDERNSYEQQIPTHAKKKSSGSFKTFLFACLGAIVGCVIVFGAQGVMQNSDSSVVLGNSSESTIMVNGEDTTLAEAVAAKVLPSVVNIDVYTNQSSFGSFGIGRVSNSSNEELALSSLGSGVVISSDGYILTNYHVVEGADALRVTVNGQEYDATVVGTDETSDLAVIKADATGLQAIEIGSSSDLKTGQWVMAAGSPYGLEQSVSTGIVSAVSRTTSALAVSDSNAIYANMIQTDAAINTGNSGGPLVDSNGKLIGINTLIASSSGSSSGVGFAIPVDYAIGIAQQLIERKTPSHAQLGVSLYTVNSANAAQYDLDVTSGAYITSVVSGSGADNAGLKEGDVITKIDSSKIESSSDATMVIRSHNPGDQITVTYYRDGAEKTATVTLGSDS